MKDQYFNNLGSERTVEVLFIEESLKKYHKPNNIVLDIGGIPTSELHLHNFRKYLGENSIDYRISDFRGGHYPGDFVDFDFKTQKFDIGIFLSSLEHFPQCTESDIIYREGYDKKGYEKCLSILNEGGYIILTVPFGKHIWQEYHQNYNWEGILNLTEGSTIIESHTYMLNKEDEIWIKTNPSLMENVLYTDRAYGVGCFILQKNKSIK